MFFGDTVYIGRMPDYCALTDGSDHAASCRGDVRLVSTSTPCASGRSKRLPLYWRL